ncbi:hypothetical protein B0J18DRAFT_485708 [Chaetomium sp. MPI-SDFR-AT-0129]|nr:hypothetical protein B0J18DRAFT_485708 [Chaetomium sp. MPI-SDFR-AT-0129]
MADAATVLNNYFQPVLVRFKIKDYSRCGSVTRSELVRLGSENGLKEAELSLSLLSKFLENPGPNDHFCLEDQETVVDGSMTLKEYVECTPENLRAVTSGTPSAVIFLTVFLLRNVNRPTVAEPPRAGILSAIDSATSPATQGNAIHPADMTAKEWGVVIKNNSLTHGFYIDLPRGKFHRVRRAAFKLRGEGAEAIPEFQVSDDSSVTVVEIKTVEEKAYVENSFSGGYAQYSAGGTGNRYALSPSVLRFPRVVVFLDAGSLQLEDCVSMLKTIAETSPGPAQEAEIKRFGDLFGHYLPTATQLGGCLHSTKPWDCVWGNGRAQKMDKMKAVAGASFSTLAVSAPVSSEYRNASNSPDTSENLTWEAKGGDTLLCSNPLKWVSTVENPYNWRVVESLSPEPVSSLINEIVKRDQLPHSFPDPSQRYQAAERARVNVL